MQRKVLVTLAIIAVIMLHVLTSSQSASAAGGNVQVRIVSGSSAKLTYVKVSGHNQHYNWGEWERRFQPGVKETTTTGWWWGSSQNIIVRFNTGEYLYCSASTNNYPWTNTETITISPNGTIRASGPVSRCGRL